MRRAPPSSRPPSTCDSRTAMRSTPYPASTDSASIVRMMNRDGMRMKFRPGSQYTYPTARTARTTNIDVATHREQQIERDVVVAQSAGRCRPAHDGDRRQHQHEDAGKQDTRPASCANGPQNRACRNWWKPRRRGEEALDRRHARPTGNRDAAPLPTARIDRAGSPTRPAQSGTRRRRRHHGAAAGMASGAPNASCHAISASVDSSR